MAIATHDVPDLLLDSAHPSRKVSQTAGSIIDTPHREDAAMRGGFRWQPILALIVAVLVGLLAVAYL